MITAASDFGISFVTVAVNRIAANIKANAKNNIGLFFIILPPNTHIIIKYAVIIQDIVVIFKVIKPICY